MYLNFSIDIPSLPEFFEHWSARYPGLEKDQVQYWPNIERPLTKEKLDRLFAWKNGMDNIAVKKMKSISRNYADIPAPSEACLAECYLNHKQLGGAIWNIFFLHCISPEDWPIFDQHTYRAMVFLQHGRIIYHDDKSKGDLGTKKRTYRFYKEAYIPFIKSLGNNDLRKLDRALFTFGKFLKGQAKYCQDKQLVANLHGLHER